MPQKLIGEVGRPGEIRLLIIVVMLAVSRVNFFESMLGYMHSQMRRIRFSILTMVWSLLHQYTVVNKFLTQLQLFKDKILSYHCVLNVGAVTST